MANGDVVNFDRYGSTTPEESEMKTLDIVMSTEANHNPHYRLQSNHHPNHLPNSLTPATMTSTSTAGTSTCDGDLRPRRPPANGGNNSGGRNVWRVLSGGYRGLRDRCHQQNNNNNLLSVCTRIFLIVVNFLFLVSGWALFGLGVWLHVYRESFLYAALFKDNPTSPMIVTDRVSLLMIGVGGFVVTVCFLGCCGACTDSVCFLAFYALMLMIAILLQICLASLAPTFRQQILESLANSMQYQIKHEYNSTAEPYNGTDSSYNILTAAWDTLQIKLGCCGARGPIDYQYSSWFNHTTYTEGEFVPSSCCVLFNVDHTKPVYKDEAQCQIEALAAIFNYPNKTRVVDDDHDSYHANIQGCHTAIEDWIQQHEYLLGVLILIIFFQIINIVYACILMSWVRKSLVDYAWCDEEDF